MSTVYGDTRARLAGKNYGNHVAFQVSLIFFALFVLFRKTVMSSHEAVDNKALDQTLPYSDNVWFQKISIPPPRKVTGNSEGEGGLKAEISEGSGGFIGSSFSRG